MAQRWYVVHVHSGFEKKVAQNLREQAKIQEMDDLVSEILVPTEEVVEIRRGTKVSAERKFFPGYILVKMEMTNQSWHLVQDQPKVASFLGAKGKPMPISEAEANRINETAPTFKDVEEECSSIGRAPVSKTGGCGFDPCHSCHDEK